MNKVASDIKKELGYETLRVYTNKPDIEVKFKIENKFNAENELKRLKRDRSLWISDYSNLHDLELIDLRSAIEEENYLENAMNVSLVDFDMMTNQQVIDYLIQYEDPVFIAYHETTYAKIYQRLNGLGLRFKFIEGGLGDVYEAGITLTPLYLNISRQLDPYTVMVDYSESSDLKFICVQKEHCLNNLPKDDTLYFDFKREKRAVIKNKIENLPKSNRYITVSTNIETYGYSIIVGYWLNQADHTYVGMFSNSSKFSLDFIYMYIMEKRDILFSDFQEESSEQQYIISKIKDYKQ